MDVVSKKVRSRMMSAIRGKDTKPELALRRGLHALGHRYSLHRKDLKGRPDLVFPRRKAVIFVHGCFWHRHPYCRHATTPSSNEGFWAEKFRTNQMRDQQVQNLLSELGWRILVIWECETRPAVIEATLKRVDAWLQVAPISSVS